MTEEFELSDRAREIIQQMTEVQENKTGKPIRPIQERLRSKDPNTTRVELSNASLRDMDDFQIKDLLHAIRHSDVIEAIHLSGDLLEENVSESIIEDIIDAVSVCPGMKDLFVFKGSSTTLDEDKLARIMKSAQDRLRVVMCWGFFGRDFNTEHIGQALIHSKLERLTLTLNCGHGWGGLDFLAMTLGNIPTLHTLTMRCEKGEQDEPVFSPEAIDILFSSKYLKTIYLENVGLSDDISDQIVATLKENTTPLETLDMKHNQFSDDALHSFATLLPINKSLKSLDLSGLHITDSAGQKLAKGMAQNTTLHYLEIEGDAERYQDEFFIPKGHTGTEWWFKIDYHLRLNRAGRIGNEKREKFVEALVSVSDHLDCIYYFVRSNPGHCRRPDVWPEVVQECQSIRRGYSKKSS